ncbi:MAG: hypothetical protein HFI68_11690 [Lachnospiraceae bacterium]|nr:hypothetical protein [Lachnospiraceae bacterium]
MKNIHEDEAKLERLNEISYMLNDLSFYMDTHPADGRAVDWFDEYNAERKELLEAFEAREKS